MSTAVINAVTWSTTNEEEAILLEREAAEKVFLGEEELAKGMSRHVLERFGKAL